MKIRRIVTGRDSNGKSVFVSDDTAPRASEFSHVPGLAAALVWETKPLAMLGALGGAGEAAQSWVPLPGGTNLMFIQFPPDAVMMSPSFDPAAAGGEYMQVLPGLAEKFEMDSPGMHTTDSIDYAVLLDGEVHLELDDGAVTKLSPRDVVIQNGTRHAWRNKSDRPATMLFVLVGTKRS